MHGPFGGPNRPVFSGFFRCRRPGLEIGEKKDLTVTKFRSRIGVRTIQPAFVDIVT